MQHVVVPAGQGKATTAGAEAAQGLLDENPQGL